VAGFASGRTLDPPLLLTVFSSVFARLFLALFNGCLDLTSAILRLRKHSRESPKLGRRAMSDDKVVGSPKPELPPEERARRLKVDVDRLSSQPLVEWLFYLPDVAKKHDV
jgi:hypothetical protein